MSVAAPISAVIPAHNSAEFIGEAIASVKSQTLAIAELIVVADACSDDTSELARSLGAFVIEGNHRNISASRNLGIRRATYEWIALLDGDDWWEQEKIECQWKALEAFPDAAIISSDLSTLIDGRISRRSAKHLRDRQSHIAPDAVVDARGTYFPKVDGHTLTRYQVLPSTSLIKRDVFERAGYFDEKLLYYQDVEFFARTLKHFPLVVVEEALVCYRIRRDSHFRNLEGAWPEYLSIVERMLRSPDQYAAGAGEAYRKLVMSQFVSYERLLAERRKRLTS